MTAPMPVSNSLLLVALRALERELHGPAVRKDQSRLAALLHDDFLEFGCSGARYTKPDILERLSAEPQENTVSEQFQLRRASETVALLTYRSACKQPDGTHTQFALRSSLWEHSARGWQMRFHQGTPSAPFAPVEIRNAVVGDAAAIAQIHVAGWQSAYKGIVPQAHLDGMTTLKRAEYWRGALAQGAPRVKVATVDQAVVGWIAFDQCRDHDRSAGGEIWAIFVHPSRVGAGVGWTLWLEAREGLSTSGFADVSLWVLARNERARRFYELAGFVCDPSSAKSVVIGGETLEEIRYARSL